jgi:DNA-binding transcriptional ArsR family regulator
MKCKSYDLFFETIASRVRMNILELLMKQPMSVNQISSALNEEQSNISHNLKKLTECHFVEAKQEGKKRIYSLNKETIEPLMKLVEKHVEKFCSKECLKNGG